MSLSLHDHHEIVPLIIYRSVNGILKPGTGPGRSEVEDGEVEDAKSGQGKDKQTGLQKDILPSAAAHTQQPPSAPTQLVNTEQANDTGPNSQPPSTPQLRESPAVAELARSAEPLSDANKEVLPPSVAQDQRLLPDRPPPSRNSSNPPSGRGQHSLPTRPEPQPYGRQPPDTHSNRAPNLVDERKDAREARYADHGRLERFGDANRDRPPHHDTAPPRTRGNARTEPHAESPSSDRMDVDRRHDRASRVMPDDRSLRVSTRDDRPPPRELDRPARHPRARPGPPEVSSPRVQDMPDHTSREPVNASMGPPRSAIPSHPERAALINPERAALINGQEETQPEAARFEAGRRPRGSRPNSPRRSDDGRGPTRRDNRREEAPRIDDRRPSGDVSSAPPPRPDVQTPTGPRGERDRPPRISLPEQSVRDDTFRDNRRPGPPSHQGPDMNRGRLSQDTRFSTREDPSYGRLNAQPPDIPSGPRGRGGGRGGRNVSMPQQRPPTPPHPPTPSTPAERPTPTGPAHRGGHRGSQSFEPSFEHPTNTTSAPPTPAATAPDTSGIHPDRLKSIMPEAAAAPSPPTRPPPLQTGVPSTQSSGPVASSASNLPPSGPRNVHAMPPSPSMQPVRGPPSGPSFNNDRQRGDKRFAGLNAMLQQPTPPVERNGQGASIRGRGGRQNSVSGLHQQQDSGPPTPIDRSNPFQGRQGSGPDLFAGRPPRASEPLPPPQLEDERGGPPRRALPEEHDSRRSSHHDSSRDNSRMHSPSREGGRLPTREDDPPRPWRGENQYDRRPPPNAGRDDRRGPPRDMREQPVPPSRDDGRRKDGRRDERERRFPEQADERQWGGGPVGPSGPAGDRRGPRGGPPGGDDRDPRERRDGGRGSLRKRGPPREDGGMGGENKRARR